MCHEWKSKDSVVTYLRVTFAAAAAKSLQSCPTLCNPIDGSPPGSTVPGILQARTLEWVAISFSNAGKWKVKVKSLSRVRLLATPWTAAYQAPPSMGFSRQEYWSWVPLPSPWTWPNWDSWDSSRNLWSTEVTRQALAGCLLPVPGTCMPSGSWPSVTPWSVARQAPLSMGLPRQEYWSGLPFPSPGDLPDPGMEPMSPCIGKQVLYHWHYLGSPICI